MEKAGRIVKEEEDMGSEDLYLASAFFIKSKMYISKNIFLELYGPSSRSNRMKVHIKNVSFVAT